MARHVLILASDKQRKLATDYIRKALQYSRIEFKGPVRTGDQNAKMWSCLSDIARELRWHGATLTADDWKIMFMDALRRSKNEELRAVPNIDNTGFVNLSNSSSDLDKEEFADLITLILMFGDERGVEFTEPVERRFEEMEQAS